MKPGIVRKYDAEGRLIEKYEVVKYKGIYIKTSDVPAKVRSKINFSFFRDALAKLSEVDATKALSFLRLQ